MNDDQPPIRILPSLLAADFGRFADECRRAEAAGADALHLDIMDGHFVRNISFGPDVVRMARRSCGLPLSVHLMIERPDLYAEVFAEAGASIVLVHVEAPAAPLPVLQRFRELGVRAGITLNPETPLELASECLGSGLVDEVLLMTVHPGFGGQSFLSDVLPKMEGLRRRCPDLDISVDGGIGDETAARCAAAGANVLIAGTTLFRAPDMAAAIRSMRSSAEEARRAAGAGA